MPSSPRSYTLFRSDTRGVAMDEATRRVEAAPHVLLVSRGSSALLVQGAATAVQTLTRSLAGWRAEENQRVRSAG